MVLTIDKKKKKKKNPLQMHGQYEDIPKRQDRPRIAYLQFSVLQRMFQEEAQIRLLCLQRLVLADCRTGQRQRHSARCGESQRRKNIVFANNTVNVGTNINEPCRAHTSFCYIS